MNNVGYAILTFNKILFGEILILASGYNNEVRKSKTITPVF